MLRGKITMKKDVVAGLGEIGSAILKLLSKKQITVGYDLDKKLVMNQNSRSIRIQRLLFYTLQFL